MKSPASMRASKRSSWAISSAEHKGLRRSLASLAMVSIACVYMVDPPLLRALIDHAARLADERAFERARRRHRDRAIDADHRLDAMPEPVGHLVAVCARMGRQHLAAHFDLVKVSLARDHELVLAGQPAVTEHDFLDLGRKEVDAADDQHVVAAPDDLA